MIPGSCLLFLRGDEGRSKGATMSKGILYDATLCIDCKLCEKGCAERNGLPYNDAIAAEEKQSEHKFTVVLNKNDKYMRRLCMNFRIPVAFLYAR